MKIFAFYLPQFHEIEENNEWWGNGFTEWTHVRRAKPLCKNHIQPIHPLNDNYYNLLDKNTICWQNDLLNKYKIDGLIYYHYYFEGKKLLEKPVEKLRESSIKQSYFFCWANHSWYRNEEGTKKLLISQTYGKEEEWEEHFKYLLRFFEDERYEKKDNKPLFMIYNPFFDEMDEIVQYFNMRCIQEGFSGIYIIRSCGTTYEAIRDSKQYDTQGIFVREPINSKLLMRKYYPLRYILKRSYSIFVCIFKSINWIETYDGNLLFELMIKFFYSDKNIIHGLFFSWDNSPRHQKRGFRINPPMQQRVNKYLDLCAADEYLFVNAWNEWAEGMVLEPTEEWGYRYLEWILEWKNANGY